MGIGSAVEMCMGMGKTGIPWVPWDSQGNGYAISHVLGMQTKTFLREKCKISRAIIV